MFSRRYEYYKRWRNLLQFFSFVSLQHHECYAFGNKKLILLESEFRSFATQLSIIHWSRWIHRSMQCSTIKQKGEQRSTNCSSLPSLMAEHVVSLENIEKTESAENMEKMKNVNQMTNQNTFYVFYVDGQKHHNIRARRTWFWVSSNGRTLREMSTPEGETLEHRKNEACHFIPGEDNWQWCDLFSIVGKYCRTQHNQRFIHFITVLYWRYLWMWDQLSETWTCLLPFSALDASTTETGGNASPRL